MDAVSAEDFLRLYHVNVVGAYQMIRAARTLIGSGGYAWRRRKHEFARRCQRRRQFSAVRRLEGGT